MRRVLVWCGVALAVLMLNGCTQGPDLEPFQERVIDSGNPDAILAEAATVLRQEFPRLTVDAQARRIETAPREFTTESQSGSARDLYGGRSTMRRVATFSVGRRGETYVGRLRVNIERRDTARVTAVHDRANWVNDTPGYDTPIERDAATSERQNNVWTFVRRDQRMERALLDEIRESFARPGGEPAAATQPGPPATAPAESPKHQN